MVSTTGVPQTDATRSSGLGLKASSILSKPALQCGLFSLLAFFLCFSYFSWCHIVCSDNVRKHYYYFLGIIQILLSLATILGSGKSVLYFLSSNQGFPWLQCSWRHVCILSLMSCVIPTAAYPMVGLCLLFSTSNHKVLCSLSLSLVCVILTKVFGFCQSCLVHACWLNDFRWNGQNWKVQHWIFCNA